MSELEIAGLIIVGAVIWVGVWVWRGKRQRSYLMPPSADCERKYVP